MKTVSVVIPFYNRLDWLYEAIESVLTQTYPIHEIILVNDGSSEDMSDFLDKYGNKIIYVYQENAGPGAARNNGIRIATGDYIAFEDSDDLWLPTKIEKQMAFIERTGAVWCHTGFYYWWPKSGKKKRVNTSRDYGDIYLQRHVSTQIATPSVIINRRLFTKENYFFSTDIRNGEDDKLYMEISRDYPIALVDIPLVLVRMRGSNSQSLAIERFHLRKANYNRWVEEGRDLPYPIHFIYGIYNCYAKIFKLNSGKCSEVLAKCLWTLPYVLERLYIMYLFRKLEKDQSYIMSA